MKPIIYIGSLAKMLDFLVLSPFFNVDKVICEKKSLNPDLLTCAFLRRIEIIEISSYSDFECKTNLLNPDVWLISSFGLILKHEFIKDKRVFNIHFGDLPKYKGRHPSFHATLSEEQQLAATLHKVDIGIDTGGIISKITVPYYFHESEEDVFNKLINLSPKLIYDLDSFLDSKIELKKNIGGQYFPRVDEWLIEISENADVVQNLNIVRAQSKYNGGVFKFNNQKYFIKKAQVNLIDTAIYQDLEGKVLLNKRMPIGLMIDDNYFMEFIEINKAT